MNAPFLTGAGSSSGILGSSFVSNEAVATATSPSYVITPSSIHTSPQELPLKLDDNSGASPTGNIIGDSRFVHNSHDIITNTNTNTNIVNNFGLPHASMISAPHMPPVLRCLSCGNVDCMVPARPQDDIALGLQHQQRVTNTTTNTPNEWTHSWGYDIPGAPLDLANFPALVPDGLSIGGFFGAGSMNGQGALPACSNDDGTLSPSSSDSSALVMESPSVPSPLLSSQRRRLPNQPASNYQNIQAAALTNTDANTLAAADASPVIASNSTVTESFPSSSRAPCQKHGNCRRNHHSCIGERQAKDEFLLACRAKGMTYREIKQKGNMTEAESTLRGRHRVLTKNKGERLRSPKWTEKDVSLPISFLYCRPPRPSLCPYSRNRCACFCSRR